jgi:hypothetical protein
MRCNVHPDIAPTSACCGAEQRRGSESDFCPECKDHTDFECPECVDPERRLAEERGA